MPGSGSPSASGGEDFRVRLTAYLKQHDPKKKPSDIDAALKKYKGKEEQLIQKLEKRRVHFLLESATMTCSPSSLSLDRHR